MNYQFNAMFISHSTVLALKSI